MAEAKFIDKYLTCAICKDEFTDPRGLPCMHRLCLQCLKDHIQSNGKRIKQKKKRIAGFKCPECRLFVKIPDASQAKDTWAAQLPADFILKTMQGDIKSGDVKLSDPNDRHQSKEETVVTDECSSKVLAVDSNPLKPSQLQEANRSIATANDIGGKKATQKMTGSLHKVISLQPDEKQPGAYDLAVLVHRDKKIIVVPDFDNHKLLLFTLNTEMEVTQKSKYDLGAKPWRICDVGKDQVAVTVSSPQGVIICTVATTVEKKVFFPTTKRYDGICALPGRKFVATVDDSVDIIRDDGTVLKEYDIKASHVKYSDNCYVAVTPNKTIVVTDCGGNTASCLKQDGKVLWCKNVKCLGVACDGAGNIFIAETGHGSIVQFSSRGRKVCRVIGESEPFSQPSGVAVDNMGYLYVICNYKDITVWKLGHQTEGRIECLDPR
ncbi:uncharacterized protein LOC124122925 [Haliotis rufescens]|uniref:uncharacterized protein LOC124122925 n=1 Tax=Haliotis rufescens TaxID=6454 RepID=UPI00201EE709|nr:uncharacterized protein LOC124122925 [Haliotis rufescens]XP_046342083.2 uncharacterized protein LOC124122925 [Haliotis rufescens]